MSSEKKPRYGVIVAARTGSSRLPGKALLPLREHPMVAYLLRRLRTSKKAGRILLATTTLPGDDALEKLGAAEGVPVFRGHPSDLVARFVEAEKAYPCEYVVRVTADCPFVDGETLDHCLSQCDAFGDFDLATTKGRFPVGIDFEVYKSSRMEMLHREGNLDAEDREHLTLHMYRHPEGFTRKALTPPGDWAPVARAFTVDTPEDYRFAAGIADRVGAVSAAVGRIIDEANT